ncbi:MAG: S-methyl-5'-thioadenosine phosphorylase [bacterium]|nr:S-methyl-5'-thioadenosine phosphorylase [bacterium]
MKEVKVGIVGGSGLYQMEGLNGIEEVSVSTPFGEPSDKLVVGTLNDHRIAFLPRHGRGHRISPTDIPVRANIYALKSLGVERIIAVSACGSLKEEIKPLDIVIPDQLYDRTKKRSSTFFEGGIVAHVTFADPFCLDLSKILFETGRQLGYRIHEGGTYICMEGPQFSTRAESNLYRQWGMDVIGMTVATEAKLAREAEICYAALAMATDYDCWYEEEEEVTVEMIIANLRKNVNKAKTIIKEVVGKLPGSRECACAVALKDAIITAREKIPAQVKEDIGLLIGKYI